MSNKEKMEPIQIEFNNGFKVSQGDKYADTLSFGEMLEAVTALTREHQRTDIPLCWMKTKEQWDAYDAAVRASAEKYRQGEDGIADVDFEEQQEQMKTIQVEIPDGKRAEWVNGVLTLVDDKPIEYKFKVGDKVKCDDTPELIYTVIGQFEEYGRPMYKLKCIWGETSSAENWLKHVSQDITERIKTFEDACKWCEANGRTSLVCQHDTVREEFRVFSEDVKKDILAYLKLRIITYALNEGWKPKIDSSEENWHVEYNIEQGFFTCDEYQYFTPSSCMMIFKSEDLAKYAAKQFADIYGDFCGVKKKGGEQ